MKIFQKGFNYSQDGAGNRLVYHLQGCNMSCPWCSNPEGMKTEGLLIEDREWLLDTVCPRNAIKNGRLIREICVGCREKECITNHRTKGIRLSFEEIPFQEVTQEAIANKMMFYDGGGVTFTGGEATLQFTELMWVLRELKQAGIHTALETNGTHARLTDIFPYVGQLIMDCKHCDDDKHKAFTGISNVQILDNIRKAAKGHPLLHIRVPLIGGVNDSKEDRQEFLEFFKSLKGENVTFEILSYHEFGKKKWEQCGLKYTMTDTAYVEDSLVKEFEREIISCGMNYVRT